MEKTCKESVRKPVSIGFLGAGPGVAEKAAECLVEKYPGLNVVFVSDEWSEAGFIKAESYKVSSIKYKAKDMPNTKYQIPDTNIVDILFLAYGFPKQERWMAQNLESGKYRVAIGVGGAFDYISGNVSRAPQLIRSLGLEWLYRLIRQPWRWKRQLALVSFVWMVLKNAASPQK